jgi:hypothetical protein
MRGGANRQEFRETFDDAEDEREQIIVQDSSVGGAVCSATAEERFFDVSPGLD